MYAFECVHCIVCTRCSYIALNRRFYVVVVHAYLLIDLGSPVLTAFVRINHRISRCTARDVPRDRRGLIRRHDRQV